MAKIGENKAEISDARRAMFGQLIGSMAKECERIYGDKFHVGSYLHGLTDAWIFAGGEDPLSFEAFQFVFVELMGHKDKDGNPPTKAELEDLRDSAYLVWQDIQHEQRK